MEFWFPDPMTYLLQFTYSIHQVLKGLIICRWDVGGSIGRIIIKQIRNVMQTACIIGYIFIISILFIALYGSQILSYFTSMYRIDIFIDQEA